MQYSFHIDIPPEIARGMFYTGTDAAFALSRPRSKPPKAKSSKK